MTRGRRRDHGEERVVNNNIRPFVVAEQRRRREVVQFGKVSTTVPINRHLGELVKRPVVGAITFSELVYIEIRRYRVGVNVERLCEKVLALLRVILRLKRVVKNFGGPYTHSIRRVCHLVNFRIGKIYAPISHTIGRAAHEHKILLVLDRAVEDLPAVLQTLPKKRLLIIARRGYAYQELVGVGLHGLLEQVVLLRLLECVNLQYVTVRAFYPLLLAVSRKFGVHHHPCGVSVTLGGILFCKQVHPLRSTMPQAL